MSLDNIDDLYKELDEVEDEKPKKPPKTNMEVVEAVVKENAKVPRTVRIKTFKIPDFNAFLKFCERHLDDYEVEQFYKHTLPRALYKKEFGKDRGGGGWSGAVKATINIMRKMKEQGVL